MLPLCFQNLFLILIIFCSLLGARLLTAGTDSVVLPPGWISTQFAGGENISSTGVAVLDEETLAVWSKARDIIVVNSKDGSVNRRISGLSDQFAPSTMLKKEGFLLFAISPTESDFVMGVYDLSANAWRGSVSGKRQFGSSQHPPVGIYRDEIRIISDNCQILRWKTADLSPLPARQFVLDVGTAGSGSIFPIGTEIDDAYCAGITPNGEGLIFESEGQWTIKKLPGYSKFYNRATYSDQFLAISALAKSGGGTLIWNKKTPKVAPKFATHYQINKYGILVNQIWNQKYSLAIYPNPDEPASKALTVLNLESPQDPPIIIPIDTSFVGYLGFPFIGITGDYFWITQRPQTGFYRYPFKFSDQPVSIKITGADASEREGSLVFKITVGTDRPLFKAVTVNLKSRSGSAEERDDYVPWEGSVLLTPGNREATAKVVLNQDKVLEYSESMFLDIVSVEGAWSTQQQAVGIIRDVGFEPAAKLPDYPKFLLSNPDSGGWALTSQGLLTRGGYNTPEEGGVPAFYLAQPGDLRWERVRSLTFLTTAQPRIIDVLGDMVAVSEISFRGIKGKTIIRVSDIASDQFAGEYFCDDDNAILFPEGILCWEKDVAKGLRYYRYGETSPAWTTDLAVADGVCVKRISGTQFVVADGDNILQLRDIANGQLVRTVKMGESNSLLVPICADSGKLLYSQDGRHTLADLAEGGNFAFSVGQNQQIPLAENRYWGALSENGLALLPGEILIPQKFQNSKVITKVIDAKTGILLGSIESSEFLNHLNVSGDFVAYSDSDRQVKIVRIQPRLPKLMGGGKKIIPEREKLVPWVVGLSGQVDFPITVKLTGLNADIVDSGKSKVIMPGSNKFEIPIRISADFVPERDEEFVLGMALSGNGFTEKYELKVTIPENGITYIDRPDADHQVEGKSMAIDPSGFVSGDDRLAYVADYRYQKGYQGERRSGFGRAVAVNSDYLAVGAVFIERNAERSGTNGDVYIFSRKKGKLLRKLGSTPGKQEAFGAVLKIVDNHLFVGAPGISGKGSVSVVDLGRKTDPVVFRQPEPSKWGNRFGTAIAAKGNSLWVGAPGDVRGKVFQFDLLTGKLLLTLEAPGEGYENFGMALEAHGDFIAVGAPGNVDRSAVFLFSQGSGKLLQRIDSPFGGGGFFGACISTIKKDTLVIGCPSSEFSPAGGLLLYEVSEKGYRFGKMLLPPKPIVQYEAPVFPGLGSIGGISGEGDVLAILSGGTLNPIDLLSVKILPGYYRVTLIDLSGKKITRKLPHVAKFSTTSLDPWGEALGAGRSVEDCQITIESGTGGYRVRLPDIEWLEAGACLLLEKSNNLIDWLPIASVDSGGVNGWQPVPGGPEIQLKGSLLDIPKSEPSGFYRIRCHVP